MKHQKCKPSGLQYYFIGYSNQVSWINIAGIMKMVHVNDVSVREAKQVNRQKQSLVLCMYNIYIYIYKFKELNY